MKLSAIFFLLLCYFNISAQNEYKCVLEILSVYYDDIEFDSDDYDEDAFTTSTLLRENKQKGMTFKTIGVSVKLAIEQDWSTELGDSWYHHITISDDSDFDNEIAFSSFSTTTSLRKFTLSIVNENLELDCFCKKI